MFTTLFDTLKIHEFWLWNKSQPAITNCVRLCTYPDACVLEWEVCYLQIFVHISLLKFMKGSSACCEMTNEFGQFYSQPTHYRMYKYLVQYILWRSKEMCINKSLWLKFLNTWQKQQILVWRIVSESCDCVEFFAELLQKLPYSLRGIFTPLGNCFLFCWES